MDSDTDLKNAMDSITPILEQKLKKRPYIVIIAKADVGFESEEDKKNGVLKGSTSYLFWAKPPLGQDGLSKLLVDSAESALEAAKNMHKKNPPNSIPKV